MTPQYFVRTYFPGTFALRLESADIAWTAKPFMIPSLGIRLDAYNDETGYVAAQIDNDNKWLVLPLLVNREGVHVSMICEQAVLRFAYPIDPSMTREDIEGATHIYACLLYTSPSPRDS